MLTRDFMTETTGVTRITGSNYAATVIFSGESAKTNGSVVYLPNLPPDSELANTEAAVMRGFADHEIAHIAYTDMEVMKAAVSISRTHGYALNVLEDMRIEALRIRDYPGSKRNIAATFQRVCEDWSAKGAERSWLNDPDEVFLICTLVGRHERGDGNHMSEQLVRQVTPALRKRASSYVKQALACKDTAEVLELVKRLLDANPVGQNEQEQGGEGEGEQEQGGQTSEGSGSGDSQSGEQGEQGEEEKDAGGSGSGEGEADEADEQGEEEGDGSGDGQGSGSSGEDEDGSASCPGGEEQGDASPSTDGYVAGGVGSACVDPYGTLSKRAINAIADKHYDYDPFNPEISDLRLWAPDMDDVIDLSKPFSESDFMIGPRLKSAISMYNREDAEAGIKGKVGVLSSMLQRALNAHRPNRWQDQSEYGRLNPRLMVPASRGFEKPFMLRTPTKDIDTAVTLLVDLSGSMMGSCIDIAQDVTLALALALVPVGVKLEVIGFATNSGAYLTRNGRIASTVYYDGQMRGAANKREGKIEFYRYDYQSHIVFKSFDTPMSIGRKHIGLINMLSHGANCDPDAVYLAGSRLAARRESRKVMIVISDGFPACDSDCRPLLRTMTTNRAKRLEAKGVEILAFGILTDAAGYIYQHAWRVDSLDHLATDVFKHVANLLLKTGNRRYA